MTDFQFNLIWVILCLGFQAVTPKGFYRWAMPFCAIVMAIVVTLFERWLDAHLLIK